MCKRRTTICMSRANEMGYRALDGNEAGRSRVASRESSLLYCWLTILLVGQTVQKIRRTDFIRLD